MGKPMGADSQTDVVSFYRTIPLVWESHPICRCLPRKEQRVADLLIDQLTASEELHLAPKQTLLN